MHLSLAHVHAAVRLSEDDQEVADSEERTLVMSLPLRADNVPLNPLLELLGAMTQATEELFGYVEAWESRKGLPPGEVRDLSGGQS